MMSLREAFLTTRIRHPNWSVDKCREISTKAFSKMEKKRLNGRPAFIVPKGLKPPEKKPERLVTELAKIMTRLRERHPDWNDEYTERIAARMLYMGSLPTEVREKILQESEARAKAATDAQEPRQNRAGSLASPSPMSLTVRTSTTRQRPASR